MRLPLIIAFVIVLASCSEAAPRVTSTAPLNLDPTSTASVPATNAPSTTGATPPPTTAAVVSTTTTTAPPVTTTTEPLPILRSLALELVSDALERPVVVTNAPGDDRLFVAERAGRIVVLDDGGAASDFLDIRDEVNDISIEQGLLGLAFHPADSWPERRFYVYYSDADDDTHLVEYVTANETTVDESSRRVVLTVDQPAIRHNAGMIQFDSEGLLYLALGDGGSGGSHGQDTSTVLGGIVRIDPAGDPYAIPPDNPFADGGGAEELWVYGARNPWRIAIDHQDRTIYVADVGQDDREEITVLSLDDHGANLGWPLLEGTLCFSERNCDPSPTVLPTLEYTHADGCSITGGFVYRGRLIPELDGHYFYGDWCSGWIRTFRLDDDTVTDQHDWTADTGSPGQINTFGLDNSGELYVGTWDGKLFRIVAVR